MKDRQQNDLEGHVLVEGKEIMPCWEKIQWIERAKASGKR